MSFAPHTTQARLHTSVSFACFCWTFCRRLLAAFGAVRYSGGPFVATASDGMMLLISMAALAGWFRIVETVTNLQQLARGLVGLRHSPGDRRSNGAEAIRRCPVADEFAEGFAEDLGKAWRFFATYSGGNLAHY